MTRIFQVVLEAKEWIFLAYCSLFEIWDVTYLKSKSNEAHTWPHQEDIYINLFYIGL